MPTNIQRIMYDVHEIDDQVNMQIYFLNKINTSSEYCTSSIFIADNIGIMFYILR